MKPLPYFPFCCNRIVVRESHPCSCHKIEHRKRYVIIQTTLKLKTLAKDIRYISHIGEH